MFTSKVKSCTSDDADEKIKVNDGVGHGGGCHGQARHQAAHHDNSAASIAIYQYAAHWTCERNKQRGNIRETVVSMVNPRLGERHRCDHRTSSLIGIPHITNYQPFECHHSTFHSESPDSAAKGTFQWFEYV